MCYIESSRLSDVQIERETDGAREGGNMHGGVSVPTRLLVETVTWYQAVLEMTS